MSKTEARRFDVDDAILIAKDYVRERFQNEGVTNIGLEEVNHEAETDLWNITVGFNRPWEQPKHRSPALQTLDAIFPPALTRTYKVVLVNARERRAEGMRNRDV